MEHYIIEINIFKYNGGIIYLIDISNTCRNKFYGTDERNIVYLQYSSSKERSHLQSL